MNLTICVNHSMPQMGGSEVVVQQIAEHMTAKGINTTIISKSVNRSIKFNGIDIIPTGFNRNQFLQTLNKTEPDHVLVYSDYFKFWPDILDKIENKNYELTLIPVGLNAALADPSIMGKFRKFRKYINVVTHSNNYQDYKLCRSFGIPVTVIPNGIDKKTFKHTTYLNYNYKDFKEKYNITTDKMVLCVSNFFPGKGQEYLPKILEKVHQEYKNFTMVFISSTVDFQYANRLRQRFKKIILKNVNFKYKFLTDIPRQDVIDAYFESDVFILPSQKEVAPLVILESMAAGLPWISMPVGNVKTLKGGLITRFYTKDVNDNFCFNHGTSVSFATSILRIFTDNDLCLMLGMGGIKMINDELNWGKISEKYYNLFIGDN